jgi:beta-mannosidase
MSLRPEPFKFLNFPSIDDIGLQITTAPIDDDELEEELERIRPFSRLPPDVENLTKITLSALLPVKGIVLDAEGPEDVKWSDQAIDLVPGDEQIVLAWGLRGRVPTARYLGDGSA